MCNLTYGYTLNYLNNYLFKILKLSSDLFVEMFSPEFFPKLSLDLFPKVSFEESSKELYIPDLFQKILSSELFTVIIPRNGSLT